MIRENDPTVCQLFPPPPPILLMMIISWPLPIMVLILGTFLFNTNLSQYPGDVLGNESKCRKLDQIELGNNNKIIAIFIPPELVDNWSDE